MRDRQDRATGAALRRALAAIAASLGAAIAPDAGAVLTCEPAAFVRTIRQGEAAAPHLLRCTNEGAAAIDYGIAEGAAWLGVQPGGAQALAPGASVDHVLAFDGAGLAAGRHDAALVVTGVPTPIAVALVVTGPSLPRPIVLQPGSQPPEVAGDPGLAARHPGFQQPPLVGVASSTSGLNACSNCHAAFEDEEGPVFEAWAGSMMAHASRDPLLWAALSVAEQAVPGSGDTCLRCHVPKAWIAGRSVPSTGSAVQNADADGVTCMVCHRLAEPSGAETAVQGAQSPPFVAASPADGAFVGSAMFSLFQDEETPDAITRLGPYAIDEIPFHGTRRSTFQRDAALCGTCHDVSNPVVGDLAPGHGALPGAEPASGYSGDAQGDVAEKAAFQLPPHAYGIEQRTYSEWLASGFATARVRDFAALPEDLRAPAGAVAKAHAAALLAGQQGDYADGTPRTFTCQSCHLPPAVAHGCIYGDARTDTPSHELIGGNHFAPEAIRYLADPARYSGDPELGSTSRLRVGGGLSTWQWDALAASPARAEAMLRSAASLRLLAPRAQLANTVRITNLTGHKLPSGYPDGRRMWLRVRWRDAAGALVREDGGYGDVVVEDLDGDALPDVVRTLLDPDARVYEVHGGITGAWARCLVAEAGAPCSETDAALRGLGADPAFRVDFPVGAAPVTLADLAAGPADAALETFQLALNDRITRDTRIPPWRMGYAVARERNALPVPPTRYLEPSPGPPEELFYRHYDDVALAPPTGAVRGELALLYQTTSWEYVRFLWKAGEPAPDPFLDDAGEDLLEAWRATGMAEPVVMAELVVPAPGGAASATAALLALAALRRARTTRSAPGAARAPRR